MLVFFFLIVNVRVTDIKITWNYYPLAQPTEYPLIYSNSDFTHTRVGRTTVVTSRWKIKVQCSFK